MLKNQAKPHERPHERIAEIKRKAEAGPTILQHSFRPFFMAAGFWAMLAVPFWLTSYMGVLVLPAGFDGQPMPSNPSISTVLVALHLTET